MAYTLTNAEQEVVIGKCADETHWTIYSTDPLWTGVIAPFPRSYAACCLG
jgi:hypothetical protein